MDRRAIGRARHQPVEDVELADEMALAHASNRRIARHLSGILRTKGDQPHARPAPGRGCRSFTSGVAGTDHQNVVHEQRLT
jgi:hypothetical protein